MARESHIGVRVDELEKSWFQRCAKVERLPVGEWMRRLAILRANELMPKPTTVPER